MVNVRNGALCALLMLGALLSGCASSPAREQTPAAAAMQQIAVDFTDVLVQIGSLQPTDTTLLWSEVTQIAGPFSAFLKAGLAEAGYDIRASNDRDHEHAVGYFRVHGAHSDLGVSGTYIVSVGDIQLRRSYHYPEDGSLVATSDMMVRGADMSRVRLDQSALSTVRTAQTDAGSPADDIPPGAGSPNLHAGIQNLAGAPAASEPFLNLFNVHEEILGFAGESPALTRQSRALLRIVVSKFDPDSDVVVLVGCSQGEFQQASGNAELAIARAQIASRELQGAGVPERNIFEAACWADEIMDPRFPQQGVVVTLKREVH